MNGSSSAPSESEPVSAVASRTPPVRGRPTLRAIAARLVVPLLLAVVGAAVSWRRLPAVARDTLWAEDGRVFIGDRLDDGPVVGLFRVYQGYLHLVPRVIADLVVSTVPVESWALATTAASCLVVGAVTALVFVCARSVVPATTPRLLIASITVLVPGASIEVLGTTANLHWYLLWATPWVLLSRPGGRLAASAAAGVVAVAGLTEIQSALYLPLALLVWRHRPSRPMVLALGASVAVQLIATLASPRTPVGAGDPVGPASTALGFLLGPVATLIAGDSDGVARLVSSTGWWPVVALLVVVSACAAGIVLRGDRGERTIVVVALVAAPVLWSAAITLNPDPTYRYAELIGRGLPEFVLLRYGVVPSMFLLTIVVVGAARLWRSTGWRRPVGAVLMVATAALQLAHLPTDETRRELGPVWSAEVASAVGECRGGEDDAVLTTAPVQAWPPSPWIVELSCDDLEAGRLDG